MRVNAEWLRSAAARRILVHFADSRPAWLWSADGATLIWRNSAARLFGAKLKKSGVKLLPDLEPIKGQVARLIRLGSPGRSSLSRIQFLADGRPASTTATVTPLEVGDGQIAALIVGVDPIESELLEAIEGVDRAPAALFSQGTEYLVVTEAGIVTDGSPLGRERYAAIIENQGVPEADEATMEIAEAAVTFTKLKASPKGDLLLLIESEAVDDTAPPTVADVRAEDGLAALDPQPPPVTLASEADEPLLPMGLAPVEQPAPSADPLPDDEPWVLEPLTQSGERLSSLFDRLAGHDSLYGELSAADEHFVPPPQRVTDFAPAYDTDDVDMAETFEPEQRDDLAPVFEDAPLVEDPPVAEPEPGLTAEPELIPQPEPTPDPEPVAEVAVPEAPPEPEPPAPEPETLAPETTNEAPPIEVAPTSPEPDVIAAVIEFHDDLEADHEAPVTHRVIGRGFTPIADEAAAPAEPEPPAETMPPPDTESVERASRYNFDELSRILTDRVGADRAATPVEIEAPIEPPRPVVVAAPAAVAEGALINIAAETFILNRLPLGIMVFRDQQVLFANRALTDLVGYETIDSLRAAGIAAIFPSEDAGNSGPVTHLVRRDGTQFPVTARLQSITWQGRPALMLSASPALTQTSHEAAVRSFAEAASSLRGEGFVHTDRQAVITIASHEARVALGRRDDELSGLPLAAFVHADDLGAMREFLEKPARFAETARPSLLLRGTNPGTTIALFTEGQAGIVAGYFGFVRREVEPAPVVLPTPPRDEADADLDPSMLARVSRGVRRPLNTIIGFADLIRSAAFGAIENHRYLEYARDIKSAGQEIAVLVDEIDDYARLRAGNYATRPAELDLVALLESCLVRVRGQANAARVLLRNGISERLPRVRADRASLGQAILNLLASAIDQTPAGSSVILSAQVEEDGHIIVNVRDSGETNVDPGERFVVFRDGVGKDGETLAPVRSSVGLALTRALVSVNGCTLSVAPAGTIGTFFSVTIPPDLVAAQASA